MLLQMTLFHSFLWPSNIPLYTCVGVWVCAFHIFFMISLTCGILWGKNDTHELIYKTEIDSQAKKTNLRNLSSQIRD